MGNITINRLPAPTWRFLKLNEALVEAPELEPLDGAAAAQVTLETGCGTELTELLDKAGIKASVLPAGRTALDLGNRSTGARFLLETAENSEVTAIMDITSGEEGFAALQTLIKTPAGAKVTLVQVIRTGKGFTLINDIGTAQGDSAQVEIIQLYLSGRETLAGIRSGLEGYKSRFVYRLGYRLGQDESLDVNIHADHVGRRTESDIDVKGVLRDNAKKLFRGTIDFHKGCRGAVGAENEEVLLLNEQVVNKTAPLILCDEEDVEGQHGASIGKLDESFVFYMMSRGLSREQIYRLMANARIEAIIRSIPDPETVRETLSYIGGETDEQEAAQ